MDVQLCSWNECTTEWGVDVSHRIIKGYVHALEELVRRVIHHHVMDVDLGAL